MGAEVELHKLVDLALRTPNSGVVNFNHLHTLLHAILNHIGLRYDSQSGVVKPQNIDYGEEKSNLATSAEQSKVAKKEQEEWKDSNGNDNLSIVPAQLNSSLNEENVASLHSRHQNLEKKVKELEGRLKVLDELPSSQTIIEQAQQTDNSMLDSATNQNTLSGIWQFMKINSRLQTLEAAIERVMSVLNEFLGSGGKTVKELRREVADLVVDFNSLKERFLVSYDNTSSSLCENNNSFENLKDTFVTKDDLLCFVQWPALEKALNVKKSDLNKRFEDSGSKDTTAHADNRQTFDAASDERPYTAPVPSTSQTPAESPEVTKTTFVGRHKVYENIPKRPCMSHPSQEMVECLRQIGELSENHNAVVKNVASLAESQQEIAGELARVENTLLQKANREELDIPDDLQDQLGMLQQGLEFLNTNQDLVAIADIKEIALDNKEEIESIQRQVAMLARLNKSGFHGMSAPAPTLAMDSGALEAIRGQLDELQTEKEKFMKESESTQAEILEDLNRKQDHIETLYTCVEKLQESKADKENVALEMDIKADKTALESKVSVSTFDNTFNMLDEGIREALQKMDDYMNEEIALKHALNQLSVDLSDKMDGQAFQALKNYLENRIADVQKSRNLIAAETKVDFSDAAGFRKSVKVNCISCSRPVEVPVKGSSVPNMPVTRGVRTKRSKGPYLSYEMDQIRQYQRGRYSGRKADIVSGRPCGGSHTVIYPPKRRTTKITQLNQVFAREEGQDIPNWGRELSVVEFLKGSDGLVYKGRFKQTIPPIAKGFQYEHELSPLTKEDLQYVPSQSHSEPTSSPLETHRPVIQEPEKENYMYQKSSPREVHQVNSRTTSPRTRMRHIVKRHSSDSAPVPLPSPSPPTVRETEYHQALRKRQKQDTIRQEGKLKPLFPASPRPTPNETEENKTDETYSN